MKMNKMFKDLEYFDKVKALQSVNQKVNWRLNKEIK